MSRLQICKYQGHQPITYISDADESCPLCQERLKAEAHRKEQNRWQREWDKRQKEFDQALKESGQFWRSYTIEKDVHAGTRKKLAAARKEIEALKKVRIDDPSSQTCGTCEHENKVSEPRCPCWNCRRKTADKWEPKKPMPAPAPVEYACPECRSETMEFLFSPEHPHSTGQYYMRCTKCHALSGIYNQSGKPHNSWLKKPEEQK